MNSLLATNQYILVQFCNDIRKSNIDYYQLNAKLNTVYHYRYAIVRDMTAAGLGLNDYCYAGLIAAHINKRPLTDDIAGKVIF